MSEDAPKTVIEYLEQLEQDAATLRQLVRSWGGSQTDKVYLKLDKRAERIQKHSRKLRKVLAAQVEKFREDLGC
jgi:hypothetical protein